MHGAGSWTSAILVADDNKGIRDLIESLLSDEGYRVVTARDGREAVAKVMSEPPALLILDMLMPQLDGYEVASELRLRGSLVPTLVMTAGADILRAAAVMGAEGYIAKPFDCWELLREVHRLVGEPLAAAS